MIWREYLKSNDLSTFPQDLLDKKIEVVDCLKLMDMMSFTIKELMDRKKWHTETPTEDGWYLITDGQDNYDVTYWFIARVKDEEDDEGEWDSTYLDKIVAWQKIEPYEED